MKNFFLLLITLLLFSCTNPEKEAKKTQVSFDEFLETYHEKAKSFFPFQAMREGDNTYNGKLNMDIGRPYRNELHAFYNQTLTDLNTFNKEELTPSEKLSYEVLVWNCNIGLESLQFETNLTPLNQFASLHLTIAQFSGGKGMQPFKTVKDYGNWANRLLDYVSWCDTAVVNMKEGIEKGITLPKPLAIKVMNQFKAFAKNENTRKHLFFTPISQMPNSFSEDDKKLLTNAYDNLLELQVLPKMEEMYTFFKDVYVPSCRETAGVGSLPNGQAFYQNQIKFYTTTNLTADEIFNLGLTEVERISKEMDSVKTLVGFNGTLTEFFEHIRTNPDLMPYQQPQQVIGHFEHIHKTMKPQLEQLFDKKPKMKFEIRRTEAFREASASAEYNPGIPDGSKPGVFYVPIPNVKAYNNFSDESLFLHEAIPGHHYQVSLQMEDTLLPSFRKSIWFNAYGEGWALYTESLGKELGLYKDPYQYFGMLSAEMHRAIRLVVDAGMHAKGWTREEAIAYSLEHEAEPEASIIAEIERYMSLPGQALSYKIGQLKILELRYKAEKELGNNFDIKGFHNTILETGCVPLSIMESHLNSWIEEQKTSL